MRGVVARPEPTLLRRELSRRRLPSPADKRVGMTQRDYVPFPPLATELARQHNMLQRADCWLRASEASGARAQGALSHVLISHCSANFGCSAALAVIVTRFIRMASRRSISARLSVMFRRPRA